MARRGLVGPTSQRWKSLEASAGGLACASFIYKVKIGIAGTKAFTEKEPFGNAWAIRRKNGPMFSVAFRGGEWQCFKCQPFHHAAALYQDLALCVAASVAEALFVSVTRIPRDAQIALRDVHSLWAIKKLFFLARRQCIAASAN